MGWKVLSDCEDFNCFIIKSFKHKNFLLKRRAKMQLGELITAVVTPFNSDFNFKQTSTRIKQGVYGGAYYD